ncbi:hypothetical protein BC826DRAFT_1110480 [Russula brevipes]|nr:hypothetical protein BC826DRAFT_1110480 [Russula brevipes]
MSRPQPTLSDTRSTRDDTPLQIPDDFQLRLTEAASQYINAHWRAELLLKLNKAPNIELHQKHQIIEVSNIINDELLQELCSIALCLAKAAHNSCEIDIYIPLCTASYINLVVIPWQMKAYSHAVRGQDGGSNSKEEIFRSGYPPLNRTVSRNCTIVDLKGNIVAWLLPDLLSERMQNIARESLHHLLPAFEHNHPQMTAPSRLNEQYYMNPELCTTFPRGAINFLLLGMSR